MSDAAGDGSKPDDIKPEGAEPNSPGKAEAAGPEGEPGTSLAPAVDGPSGIDPFLAKAADASEPAAPRPLYAKALDYSAHAAMIVGLIGFAWTVSDHVTSRPQPAGATTTPVKAADAAGTATPKTADAGGRVDELGELRKSNQKMAAEIRGLHASLEALRTTVVRDRGAGDDVRALSTAVDQVKAGLAAARSEQTTQIAQLTGKVDKLQRDTRQQVARAEASRAEASRAEASRAEASRGETARADRAPERQLVDTTATASIPAPAAKSVPTPPAKPTVLAAVEADAGRAEPVHADKASSRDDDGKPQVIAGWVVRDVYQGVALIEGHRGSMEVVPGVSIPGAGVVRSIDRHGGGWTVTTTKGQLASAAQQHEQHRGGYRDYYAPPSVPKSIWSSLGVS